MKSLPAASVDFILTDPPYGTTACAWDSIIPFEPMWAQLRRIRKGAIGLFGNEPFSSALRMSNIKEFKYDWIWSKNRPSGIGYAKYRPMGYHEIISIFGPGKLKYYPQRIARSEAGKNRTSYGHEYGNLKLKSVGVHSGLFNTKLGFKQYDQETKNPSTVLPFNKEVGFHPTQKPIALLEYLIKTYTLEGETVLDFTMGSGSTGVACKNLNRKFIGIEKDEKYYKIACERIGQL